MKNSANIAPSHYFVNSKKLIDSLSESLPPVTVARHLNRRAIAWLFITLVISVSMIHLFGPIRGMAWQQLIDHPRFALEMLIGIATLVTLSIGAVHSCIPGRSIKAGLYVSLSLFCLLLSHHLIGLFFPTIEPSLHGKRSHCALEVLVYSIPPLMVAAYMANRFFVLRPIQSTLLFGFTVGLAPALYMQIACMYSAEHALLFHILPGIAVAPLAASAVYLYRKLA